ncbi:MAG: HAMP domain-containing histidine kinase [Synergistetes bacterium]|nr:MAG: Histidine kinase [bacterium 42_11]MBC7331580.1 HAMP domain-containing histidine kinase [Synergistota bacterium]
MWKRVKAGIGTRITILTIIIVVVFALSGVLEMKLLEKGRETIDFLSAERFTLNHLRFLSNSLDELQRDFEIVASIGQGWIPIAEERINLIKESLESLRNTKHVKARIFESFSELRKNFSEFKKSSNFKKLEECVKLAGYASMLLKQTAREVEFEITTAEINLKNLLQDSQRKGWTLYLTGLPVIIIFAYLIIKENKRTNLSLINYLKEIAIQVRKGVFPISTHPLILKLPEGETLASYINELIERINESMRKMKELSEAKTSFLSIASHELKTPLTSILGFSEVLLDRENLTWEERKYLNIIKEEAQRLSNIVERMLAYIRLNSRVDIKPIDIRYVINATKEGLENEAKRKGIKLKVEIPDKEVKVETDRERLEIALREILDNAIKFTEVGEIKVSLKESKDRILIEIEDSGPGIDEKKKESIVELFTQGEGFINRKHEGLGLGLPLAIKALNGIGTLSFESTGKGSKFYIKIFKDIENSQKYDMIKDDDSL